MKIRATLEIPDRSITRTKLEYPTSDVSFSYLASINMVRYIAFVAWGYILVAKDSFVDKAVLSVRQVNLASWVMARIQDYINMYGSQFDPPKATGDHYIMKRQGTTDTTLAIEAIDIDNKGRGLMISCSGSTIKSFRYELLTALDPIALPAPNGTISATDTTFASGFFGFYVLRETFPHSGSESGSSWLKAPMTRLPLALAVLEVEVEGSGAPEDPYRPLLNKNLVKIAQLTGPPDFLYREAKKYEILRNKGFTDDEIKLLLGYTPQHQVDLQAITYGAFEFKEDSPTNIIVITGDNPYLEGAVKRQAELAKSKNMKVLKPPKNYGESVAQFNQLKREFKHWLAGKDNYAYQTLGLEELDLFQNIDFYHGELIEHKTHYQQLKQVPDFEMWRRLEILEEKLDKITVLTEERDKHIAKLREVKRLGW